MFRGRSDDDAETYEPDLVVHTLGRHGDFRLSDAVTGVIVFGATGSGKTSGPGKFLASGYLAHGFGGVVLCAKAEEREQWQKWAEKTERTKDLIIISRDGPNCFNPLDWEAARKSDGGGIAINVVALLDELIGAVSGPTRSGGDAKFFEDALHHLSVHLVGLVLLVPSLRMSFSVLCDVLMSAPRSRGEGESEEWWRTSICAQMLDEAHRATENGDAEAQADFQKHRDYWLIEFPALAERTRSIVTMSFSMLVQPFTLSPLRRLLADKTTIKPEATFGGKVIIVDLPVQQYGLAGRVANLVWKYCFQKAVMRRGGGQDQGKRMRPVFLWADEAQNFVTEQDSVYQAVARSARGCTVYLTQNREMLRRVLASDDRVDSLLGNLQSKWFCQNAGSTNEWAAKLLGERWVTVETTSSGAGSGGGQSGAHVNVGTSEAPQRRLYVEPSRFTTLRRGGPHNGYKVEAVLYNGGQQYEIRSSAGAVERVPYVELVLNQLDLE
jgi:type IV secretory pathway TraG/TraD family ATPase VirD4